MEHGHGTWQDGQSAIEPLNDLHATSIEWKHNPYLDVVDADIALLDGVDGVGDDDDHADRDDGREKADDQEAALRFREVGHPARVLPPA